MFSRTYFGNILSITCYFTDFQDHEQISALVRQLTGAGWVVICSYSAGPPPTKMNRGQITSLALWMCKLTTLPPMRNGLCRARVAGGFPRYILINVWHSISSPPQDCLFGLVDGSTVGNGEGIPYPIIGTIPEKLPMRLLPETHIEGCNFVYRVVHEWKYFSNMTKDEALIFRLYDSDRSKGSKWWRYPHTAFYD